MNFGDLDWDCVFHIFEYLDLGDLLNVAQINDQFNKLAVEEFRHKYSQLRVVVKDTFKFPDKINEMLTGTKIDTDAFERIHEEPLYIPNRTPNITVSEYQLELDDFQSIFELFKQFGHMIKKLECQISSQNWRTGFIGYLISKYSSESLVDVELAYHPDSLLVHITKSLTNVQNITFKNCHYEFETPHFRFAELFPAVRRLNMRYLAELNLVHFDCHMPHLEHVYVWLQSHNSTLFLNIAKRNPQIRSIALHNAFPEIVQEVNALLPQLETLKLEHFKLMDGRIEFGNVTTFICSYGTTIPVNLYFPRLRSLKIDYTHKRFYDYCTFFNEHSHLRHLHMKGFQLDDSQFQKLTANLNNLEEITLRHRNNSENRQNLSCIAIAEFLKSRHTVNQLNFINFPKHWEDELQELLEQEWNVRIININGLTGLSFQRN